ncbi:hypothetical protein ELI24_09010 [Rhizobium ruizarguesonis]|uniref:hypothetical protein n=1 Tax=Rhizobium ruizarguesonis TaxID=2081791 RepID=UPI0010320FBB|nr:hypothetical protein [Rhizobium ruizarguesonis]TAV98513.1 hypothetical protein ELI24_09010 [Rhizobium ruizarguesonis]
MVQKIPPSMTQSGLPPQYLVGLETSRDPVVPTKRIVVSPGSCRSQLDDTDIELTAGIMKRLDQNWAAGSGNGALDQGSLAASTWYHLHVMQNPTTGAVDVLASGSLTNPAYPTGWEAAPSRRVWSVLTDASANIVPYTQTEDWCAWGILENQYGGNLGASSTVITMKSPIGFKCEVQFLILTSGAGGGEIGLMDPDVGDPSLGRFYTVMIKQATLSSAYRGMVFTDVNGRTVGWADANITSSVQTVGYRDTRGKR